MGDLHAPTTSAAKPALAVAAALLLSLAFGAGAADAHALLDHADPRVGNTVKSPRAVSLWFTQNLERGFCSVDVLDASGARMNAGNAVVDGKLMRVLSLIHISEPTRPY